MLGAATAARESRVQRYYSLKSPSMQSSAAASPDSPMCPSRGHATDGLRQERSSQPWQTFSRGQVTWAKNIANNLIGGLLATNPRPFTSRQRFRERELGMR